MSYVVLGVIEALMDTNDEVRRRRLARLCREVDGGLPAIAAEAGLSAAALDQILKKVLLPEKEDGTRTPKALGDGAARKIEAAYALQDGWLDWPFEAVDYQSYARLTDLDRGVVQAYMMGAIKDRLESHIYGAGVNPDRDGKALTKVVIAEPRIDGKSKKKGADLGLREFQVTGKGLNNEADKTRRVPKQRGNKRA